jgi:hypothetical protein
VVRAGGVQDADREPTAFYILCFAPGSDLLALGEGARSEQDRVTCPPRATCAAGSRAGEA